MGGYHRSLVSLLFFSGTSTRWNQRVAPHPCPLHPLESYYVGLPFGRGARTQLDSAMRVIDGWHACHWCFIVPVIDVCHACP